MTNDFICSLSDEELIRERNRLNAQLEEAFFSSSHVYDVNATLLKEIEREINRREHDGPPWYFD